MVGASICSWCSRSLDQSLLVNPLNCSLFQPVLYKGHGMYCPVYGMVHMKDPLVLIEKSSP